MLTSVDSSTIHNSQAWGQARSPSVGKWIKKMWSIYTIALCSPTKKDEIKAFAGKWVELKKIMLGEISQFSLIFGS